MKFEYNTLDYIKKIKKGNSYFHTFLDNESLASGILSLNPGEEDTQLPHDSDEIYYILEGNGYLKINKKKFFNKKNYTINKMGKGSTEIQRKFPYDQCATKYMDGDGKRDSIKDNCKTSLEPDEDIENWVWSYGGTK